MIMLEMNMHCNLPQAQQMIDGSQKDSSPQDISMLSEDTKT